MSVNVDFGGQRSGVTVSYHGLCVDHSVDFRWRLEADLIQQLAVLAEHISDL